MLSQQTKIAPTKKLEKVKRKKGGEEQNREPITHKPNTQNNIKRDKLFDGPDS